MIKKLILAGAAAFAFAGVASAATDGTLGHHSTGSVNVGVRLPLLVDITGLSDIHHTFSAAEISAAAAIASYSPIILNEHDFCVYSNNGVDGAYSVKISGPAGPVGGNENFGLNGPAGSSIPMRVWFTDVPGNIYADSALFPSTFPNGTKVSGFKADNDGHGRPATLTCTDTGKDAGLAVQFPVGGILAAVAGHYHGQLTVTVSPT